MTVLAARSPIFICLTYGRQLFNHMKEQCQLRAYTTQEHDCVCRNTRPGNSANSTTWPNQSTVISVNFVDHFCCMSIPCNITGDLISS